MTLIFSWTHWEFWVLALLLWANLTRGGGTECSHSEIMEKLDEIESELSPPSSYPSEY